MNVKLADSVFNLLPLIKRRLEKSSIDQIFNKAIGLLYVWLQMCEGKREFKNMKLAAAACQNLKESGKLTESHKPYKCLFCDKFHIGRSRE